MKINPYLYFNGNAAEAVAFYEKAFDGKAIVLKYKDVAQYDKSYEIASGTENYVMHANMNLGDSMIMFCDVPPAVPYSFSNGVQLMVSLESEETVKKVFSALKDGGEVTMDLQKTFWSECFGSIKDKFGIHWLLSYEKHPQK